MMKSIAASTVTLSYALAIFYLSFVSAGTLGVIYKRVGITGVSTFSMCFHLPCWRF